MFDLDAFISKYVIQRPESMFLKDIENNRKCIAEKINSKTVLVIGGAGSIGSSFIKAILHFEPKSLIVVDTNENALAELTRDIRSDDRYNVPQEYIPYPMNYASKSFEKMFRHHKGFDIVANFSAHKHVRSEKDIYSLECLLNNNVIYAKKLLDLLSAFPPEEYFCVSTDKAANPVNVMGASKRVMEDLIFSYSDRFPVKTARFANVAFSNGSLPDGFIHRLNKLQPLSAPSDVTRYFVSPEESGQICMLACMLGNNREIYFPKLEKEQMKSFDDIARDLLHEYGYEVLECNSDQEAIEESKKLKSGSKKYPVHFSESDTSGEKEYEEFYTEEETVDLDRFNALGVIKNKEIPSRIKIDKIIKELNEQFENDEYSKEDIVKILSEYLLNFKHIETGKSLDFKM